MSKHRTVTTWIFCAATLVVAAPDRAKAQDAPKAAGGYASLEDLRTSYGKQLVDLDRHRIADLTTLTSKLTPEQAEDAYRELFNIAIGRDLYAEAEAAAHRYLATGGSEPRDRSLATLVALIAKANRGEYEQSLADLQAAFKNHQVATDPGKRVDPSTAISLGEAYIQRLLRGGRYDIAEKVCKLAIERLPDPAVKTHFQGRLDRIAMVGKTAPEIIGTDVDGKTIKLSDLKGKVVLIDFWATWCPPCVAAFPALKGLDTKYGDKGLEILGINLDGAHQDVATVAKASPYVRRFLLANRASWPNILIGTGGKDDALSTYGVTEIPASFLVDKTGKIIHVELSGAELEKAIATALGAK